MNIFVLHIDPQKAAEYHMDVHVIKMILESAQMLSTVARRYEVPSSTQGYRSTHKNHPCTVWAAASFQNWLWLYELWLCLCREYEYRYNKVHKTYITKYEILTQCKKELRNAMPHKGLTIFAQAMPAMYKVPGNPVAAYRKYYLAKKVTMFRAGYRKTRPAPKWLYFPVTFKQK